MAIGPGGFVLRVPRSRREDLLAASEEGGSFSRFSPTIAEPVPYFSHSRQAPLVVFASFESGKITHIAEGKRGMSAGTGLVRLNLQNLDALDRPIPFARMVSGVPSRFRKVLKRILTNGGLLPPKTFQALVDCLVEVDSGVGVRLSRFAARRREIIRRLRPRERQNLALQKESLGIALEIGGISRDVLLDWSPAEDGQQSFLDGLPGVQVREDAMLLRDLSNLPGFEGIRGVSHYGSKLFESADDPAIRMTVIMANRLPLEEQTGADLIYFNEAYRCFVMVQYKAMESGGSGPEFRWAAGDQFTKEIARMDHLNARLESIVSSNDPDGFRFSSSPFFLKFCPRLVFNPETRGLSRGIYLPLELWKRSEAGGRLRGIRGGNVLSFANVGRRINNSEFVGLVAGAWVGTTIEQSAMLADLVREVLESGKTVTLAIKHVGQSSLPVSD